jgi:uncharacterized protein YcbX
VSLGSFDIERDFGCSTTKEKSFANESPFLILSRASCRELQRRTPSGFDWDLTHFRGNIILDGDGAIPFSEDSWVGKIVHIGELQFKVPSIIYRLLSEKFNLKT